MFTLFDWVHNNLIINLNKGVQEVKVVEIFLYLNIFFLDLMRAIWKFSVLSSLKSKQYYGWLCGR